MRNTVINPSANVDLTGWAATLAAAGAVSITRLTGAYALGAAFDTYARMTVTSVTTGAVSGTGIVIANPSVTQAAVVPGVPFTVSAYARCSRTREAQIVVTFHDAAGATLNSGSSAPAAITGSAFVRLSVTVTPAAGAVRAYIRVYSTSGSTWAVGDTMDVGGVMVTLAGVVPYFDGDTAGRWWVGTRGAAESAQIDLSVAPNPATGSVVLDVYDGKTALTITRADANGTRTVRARAAGAIANGSGRYTITDREAALSGNVTYTVIDSAGGGVVVATTLATPDAPPRITNVTAPTTAATPLAITGYEATSDSGTVVHWVEGRPDPVVILRPAHTREGTLTALVSDYAAAVALAAVMRPGVLLMLRQGDHPGLDMYFVVTRSTVQPLEQTSDGWAWSVLADYAETAVPTLSLAA